MKNFGTNDTIFARATRMGREIFNLQMSGIASMESVYDLLRGSTGVLGLVNLTVRNVTQGWTATGAYRLNQ